MGLYAGRPVSLGRAASIAGIPYVDFMHEIGHRGICINYTLEDAVADFFAKPVNNLTQTRTIHTGHRAVADIAARGAQRIDTPTYAGQTDGSWKALSR